MAKYFEINKDNIVVTTYRGNGNIALRVTTDNGEPLATLSTNLDDVTSGEVAIKDWSENEGILQDLIDLGVVAEPHRHLNSGFCVVPICKLLLQKDNNN